MSSSAEREIIVVGGGIIGVCSAYYLVSAIAAAPNPLPISVTLVEQEGIACAASGKAGGFLALDWHGPETTSLASLSYDLHQALAIEFDGSRHWGYREMDSVSYTINTGSSDTPPEDNPALADSHVHFKEPNENRALEVDWLCTNGQTNVLGTKKSTSQIHPGLFTKSIFAAAVQKGLRFVRGRPTKLNFTSSASSLESLEVVTSATATTAETSQTLRCTDLILATGPWTKKVASTLGILPVPPITILPGHSVLIRPPPGATLSPTAVFAGIYGANPDNTGTSSNARITESPELFPRPDGTVFVGGENVAQDMPDHPKDVDALMDEEIAERLVRAAKVVANVLGEGSVEARQLCYRPTTPDRRPVIGKLMEHVWVAAGHGPWGISLAPGTGKVVAELVLDGEATSADIRKLDPSRFNQ